MSTLVGHVVTELEDKHTGVPAHVIAAAISLVAGGIITGIGLLRLGWIVDLISLTSLSAFMTGSAITIGVGQLPNLLGIRGVNNTESPYLIIINTLKHLRDAKVDAAVGLSALTMLYMIRSNFVRATKRWPMHQKQLFFANTLRTVFVILLYTLISFLVNRTRTEDPAFKVIGEIPIGRKKISYAV
jgi:sodium-independent sulfate anion transporter 11